MIAGPVITAPIHFGRKSHPCCRVMTGGKLPCYCDDHQCSIRVMGYVPIMTTNQERIVVTVSAMVAEQAKKLEYTTPVFAEHPGIKNRPIKIGRLSEAKASGTIRRLLNSRPPADISEYLLHLWQNRTLTEHFGFRFRPSGRTLGRGDAPEAA